MEVTMGQTRLVTCLLLLLTLTGIYAQRYDLPEGSSCTSPSSQRGLCTRVKDCPFLYNLLVNRNRDWKTERFLQRSTCSFDGNTPILCCPGRKPTNAVPETNRVPVANPPTSQTRAPKIIDVGPQPLVQMDHPNRALLPQRCGSETNQNIVGGVNASLEEHPWLVAIEYINHKGPIVACGGALISERYVVTAAHCLQVTQNERLSKVRLGEHNLMTDPDCVTNLDGTYCADKVVSIPIERAFRHPEYRSSGERPNDIGLIRLSRPVVFTDYIRPICLPGPQLRDNFEGTKQTVAGWGNNGEKWQSVTKLKVQLPVISNDRCNELYKERGLKLLETQMCAGGVSGKDSCQGDSGGPIMLNEGRGRSDEPLWYVTGVVSQGPKNCGQMDQPGVYTRVRPYINWILDTLRQ